MVYLRRVLVWSGGMALLALILGVLFTEPAPGQAPSTNFSGLKLTEESKSLPGGKPGRLFIRAAKEAIDGAIIYEKKGQKEKANYEWNEAVDALQILLDIKEDCYVKVEEKDAEGKETIRWASVRFEANNLLGSMPSEGLDVYELKYGARARDLLEDAKKRGDREQLAEVAQRFLHTRAGAEANDLLATSFLDRGQHFMAALRFEKVLKMNPSRVRTPDLTLFKAALAFRRAGESDKFDKVWKLLEENVQNAGGLKIGDNLVPLARLQKLLDEIPPPGTVNPHDWPLIRGDQTNSAQATGSPPVLDTILWQRPTVYDRNELTDNKLDPGKDAKKQIEDSIQKVREFNPPGPVMPGFFPIASGNLLVYRSHLDVRAVHPHAGKDFFGEKVKAGELAWTAIGSAFSGSLANLYDSSPRETLKLWLSRYERHAGIHNLVFENSLLGTLATDHRLVYAIDDLAVPVDTNHLNQPVLKDLILQNSLNAIRLTTGKIEWTLGGKEDPTVRQYYPDVFTKSHFLGVPLSIGGKLYVLNEKNSGQAMGDAELRLVCFESRPTAKTDEPFLHYVQPLGNIQQMYRMTHDISRRTHASHLAYGEGILVCPTNAGEILGVDLLSRSLAWSYPYRESFPPVVQFQGNIQPPFGQPQNLNRPIAANWKSAPPVIQNGKVVFTAPDASSIHCINLRDGTYCWHKSQQPGDLFLAGVFMGKVLIVGKNSVRFLDLETGSSLVDPQITGDMPSGQGVACKNFYYLPLARGEICKIDIARGRVEAHNRARVPGPPPGNLVFYQGSVFSQTPLEIVAYPQLHAQLELAQQELQAEPGNPARLVKRGELLLADGQVQQAVEDFQKALAIKPAADLASRAKSKLYEALTDLFQIDFSTASSKYLDEYQSLCKEPGDSQERDLRQARFYRLMGHGREKQGNLVEAFKMYKAFGEAKIHQVEGGIAALDDPTHRIPAKIWLRGRISAMMAKATPEQRRPLEATITEEWKEVQAKKDLSSLRSFASMFDVPFSVGREARLQLAETIIDRQERSSFLEAELNLFQLLGQEYRRNPQVGGRALAALALLEEKKALLEDKKNSSSHAIKTAMAYYRQLNDEFPSEPVRGGKTGSQLFQDLAAYPPFLLFMGQGNAWSKGKISARELKKVSAIQPARMRLQYSPKGEVDPALKNLRVLLENSPGQNNPQLRILDLSDNKILWSQFLGSEPLHQQYFQFLWTLSQGQSNQPQYSYHPDAHFRFSHSKGHLAVVQVGIIVYGIDMDQKKILWQHRLMDPHLPNHGWNFMGDSEGNPELLEYQQFGNPIRKALGHIGTVQASYVALVTQKGLVVLDPLRGGDKDPPLWTKLDVPPTTHAFGDEEFIFLVDPQGSSGRALRAADGTSVEVANFGNIYRNRKWVSGRKILAALETKSGITLRLYDIPTGKDVWSKSFDQARVLESEHPDIIGVIEPDGKIVILDTRTGREILNNSVVQQRIAADDIKNLHKPLLLQDEERIYVALNTPRDAGKVFGTVVFNNFSTALRSQPVNGWVLAFAAKDQKIQGKVYKKGDFLWHSKDPLENQMLVLEQFESLPFLLFTTRYNKRMNNGGSTWVHHTQSLNKATGQLIFNQTPQLGFNAQFDSLVLDVKSGTITLTRRDGTGIQHYLDNGNPAAAGAAGAEKGNPAGDGKLQPLIVPPGNGQLPPGIAPGRPPVRIQALPAPIKKK